MYLEDLLIQITRPEWSRHTTATTNQCRIQWDRVEHLNEEIRSHTHTHTHTHTHGCMYTQTHTDASGNTHTNTHTHTHNLSHYPRVEQISEY